MRGEKSAENGIKRPKLAKLSFSLQKIWHAGFKQEIRFSTVSNNMRILGMRNEKSAENGTKHTKIAKISFRL